MKARVLVVEDEAVVALDLEQRLRRLGYAVAASTATGEEALVLARSASPDVALMDIHLAGGCDGIEAATRLAEDPGLPVVFLTAHSDERTIERAKRAQPYGYLVKPFDDEDLASAIEVATHKFAAERRKLEAHRFEAIGSLAAGIAHELNNLLQVIQGHAWLIQESASAENVTRAAEIRLATDRAAGIVREVLAYGRKQTLAPRLLDLDERVRSLEGILAALVRPSTTLRLALGSGVGPVELDPDQLEHVLVRLALRARRTLGPGSTLLIGTSEVVVGEGRAAALAVTAGTYVELLVRDDGPALDAPARARLLEPYAGTGSLATEPGIGLAAIEGLVRQSGGFVEIESAPGAGTAFRLAFPRARGTSDGLSKRLP